MSCILLVLTATAYWAHDLRDLTGMTQRCLFWVLSRHSEFSIMRYSSHYSSLVYYLKIIYTEAHLSSLLSFATFLLSPEVLSASWQLAWSHPQTWRFHCILPSPGHWWNYLIKPVSVSIPQRCCCWKETIHPVKQPKSPTLCFLFFN